MYEPRALEKMNYRQLSELETRIAAVKIEAKNRQRSELKEKIEGLLKEAGFTAHELFGPKALHARNGNGHKKVAPKYINPKNRSETWAGRGRQPRWLTAEIKRGGTLEQFAVH